MRDQFAKTLDAESIEELKLLCQPRLFQASSEIIYEGQIPNVSLLIVEGEARVFKRKRAIKVLPAGTLIGLKELLMSEPIKTTIQILSNSRVCILDKSTLKDFFQHSPKSLLRLVPSLKGCLQNLNETN